MIKISENTFKKLASDIVDKIEENMGVSPLTAVGPAQAIGFGGSLSNIGSAANTGTLPNGVGNTSAKAEKGAEKASTSTGKAGSTNNKYGKLPEKAAVNVLALVNAVNGPLGRTSGAAGTSNVPTVTTTVSGVKSTIDQIGKK